LLPGLEKGDLVVKETNKQGSIICNRKYRYILFSELPRQDFVVP